MKERFFIQKAKENQNMEEFIRKKFSTAKCGRIEVQRTPIMTRIVIYTTTVGLVIGTGGEKIKEAIEALKKEFTLENPQIDVQKIENADLDPFIVAQNIAYAIESGTNYKRLGNYYIQKIINAGAVGTEIIITGKVSGERSRKERFTAGYLKKCGYPAQTKVFKGYALATPRLGSVGVTVKIMPKYELEIPVIEQETTEEVFEKAEKPESAEKKPEETTEPAKESKEKKTKKPAKENAKKSKAEAKTDEGSKKDSEEENPRKKSE